MRRRRDIHDDLDESLFDQEEAEARRIEREQRRARAEEQGRERAAEDAAIAARAAKFRDETNARMLVDEYRRAGVEPPKVDGDGAPTCSLTLLLWMGWTIEELGLGVRRLVSPPPPAPVKPRSKECS